MLIDPEIVSAYIREIAQEEIAGRYGKLRDDEIITKSSPTDFATEADFAAEARLEKALCGLLPGSGFVGEEIASKDPSVGDQAAGEGVFWIVDPLDGTRNFVNKKSEFGTIVALVENGEIRQGWIYAILDDQFAVGSASDGAYWNGERIGACGDQVTERSGYRSLGYFDRPWHEEFVPAFRNAYETEPAHCSAFTYINLLRGVSRFALYSRCHPWDHAAGILFMRETGGRDGYLPDGTRYRPVTTNNRALLIARLKSDWETLSHDIPKLAPAMF